MHYHARPAWRNQWLAILALAVVCLAFIAALVLGWLTPSRGSDPWMLQTAGLLIIILLLPMLYRKYAWFYTIDLENIESTHGIISRDLNAIRIKDVRNINVRQTVMQRLLGIGDVEFSSAGGGDIEVIFYGVSAPLSLKALAQKLQDQDGSVD